MPFTVRLIVFCLGVPMISACRVGTADDPKFVAECVEYQEAFARCTGRHEPLATQPAAIPTSDEQRAALKKLCAANLERLRTGCPEQALR